MNTEQYKTFFDTVWDDFCNQALDFETGVYIQETAKKAGLVVEVDYNPLVHGEIDDTEIGDTIFVRKEAV